MVKYYTHSLDYVFSALADATRRSILSRLALGETTVTELAKPFKISLPAVSKHLRILERAGLLKQEKNGRIRQCCLQTSPLAEANDWIGSYKKFWGQQLDSLSQYIDKTEKEEKKP